MQKKRQKQIHEFEMNKATGRLLNLKILWSLRSILRIKKALLRQNKLSTRNSESSSLKQQQYPNESNYNKMLLHRANLFIYPKTLKPIRLMSYLHIAQKNSIAKEVSNILSDGTKKNGPTKSQFNQVYEFKMDNQLQRFSSVRGHIYEFELPQECKSWAQYDNRKILTRNVEIIKKPGKQMDAIIQNIQDLAQKSRHLILWLDCDRQGQAIAFEVIEVCRRANPLITIQRARFSAVTRQDILQAYHNLVLPNERESNSVLYRMEIDFRLGCTFTRYQTLVFREKFPIKDTVLSYGPCQLPTLGFVVQRYLEIKYFKPEDYYFLKATCIIDQNTGIEMKWTKANTRSKTAIMLIFNNMYLKTNKEMKGKVKKRSKNTKKRYRPYPLTTVQLQKLATDKLRMSSARLMQIAESLYTKGYISYPRTQTNAFPKTMNLKSLVDRLRPNNEYIQYIGKLLDENKFQNPKTGNSDDQAHSPIHPVKNMNKDTLGHDEWRVYDMISRHFLACCSKDAVGDEYETLIDIGDEEFKATYLTIREKNFLEIYPYIKWSNSALQADIPQEFDSLVEICEQKTKPPPYLSESSLIECMQKNNIGTDSTIHQHIETIQKRKYAVKNNNTFKPTSLGASLIIAYKNLGMVIADCDVRRMMEQNMEKIAQGLIAKETAAEETLSFMRPIYDELNRSKSRWLTEISKAMEEHKDLTSILEPESSIPNENSNSYPNRNFNQGNRPQNNFNNSTQRSASNASSNKLDNITCYRCQEKGHFAPNCPNIGLNGKAKGAGKTKSEQKSNNFKSGNFQKKPQANGGSSNNGYGNYSGNNYKKQEQKKVRKPKVCEQCGVQGRHPKNSTCGTLKKNKNNLDFL